jgi:hypothetical protein
MASKKGVDISGKIIHSQAIEVIANVLKFMKEEAANGPIPRIPLANFKQRLIAATGISDKTYRKISKDSEKSQSGSSFSSPPKRKSLKSSPNVFCAGELSCIRDIIYNFHVIEKRRPSLKCRFVNIDGIFFLNPCCNRYFD